MLEPFRHGRKLELHCSSVFHPSAPLGPQPAIQEQQTKIRGELGTYMTLIDVQIKGMSRGQRRGSISSSQHPSVVVDGVPLLLPLQCEQGVDETWLIRPNFLIEGFRNCYWRYIPSRIPLDLSKPKQDDVCAQPKAAVWDLYMAPSHDADP